MKFWATQAEAERYAKSRPYFHALVIDRVRSVLRLDGRVRMAVDVGAGSGQSTAALEGLAESVAAIDPSRPMLQSTSDLRADRLQAVAESLPLADACCDLMTAALSFHWLDRERFLPEAARVLRPSGWLVIYNNYFLGRMRENPSFQDWVNEQYLTRYPVPERRDQLLTPEAATASGLAFVERQVYANEVTFDVDELASYLMTQTNVLAAVELGTVSSPDAQRWLMTAVAPLFPVPRCTFDFGGYIWYLRHAGV